MKVNMLSALLVALLATELAVAADTPPAPPPTKNFGPRETAPAAATPATLSQASAEGTPAQDTTPAIPPQDYNAGRKLGRGFSNLLFGVVEVPNQLSKSIAEQGGGGAPLGLGKGIGRWLWREVVGVYEIITFPFPAPSGYKPIVIPEWPNEKYEL